MKFNERWVREWVDPPIDTEELAARLTAAGLEVESIEPVSGTIEGVTVAEVVGVVCHPGADKLSLCDVDDGGGEPRRVVCGAPNVRPGLRTAFARVGARLPDGTKIRRSRIRGELSQGMLCSARELGLGEEADGILELDAAAPVGVDLVDWLELDDVVMEVGLTPNRGDCLCIVGLAREVSVASRIAIPRREHTEIVKPVVDDVLPVVLDAPQRCPRYVGRVVRGIDPGARSPLWMTERLRRCGVRPLSAVVDVTNYVMLELGQPMHAFDLARLDSGIRVRNGRDGESLELLDGSVVELDADSLVIADESRPVALAGVMGGLESGVTGGTRDVFLESAWFEPRTIALESRRRGMHTDASHRFERTVAPDLQRGAMERATRLLVDVAGGAPGPIIEAVEEACVPVAGRILLREERIRRVLGAEIPAHDVHDILSRLGMRIDETHAGWLVVPPAYRPDIGLEVDLIEEIARVFGFANLPGTIPAAGLGINAQGESHVGRERIRACLVDRGYHEAVTYSFVDARLQGRISPAPAGIALANPIASNMGVMRTTLWPGLIEAALHNANRQQSRIRLFETGLVFLGEEGGIRQPGMIGAIAVGPVVPEQWADGSRTVDFYDVKGDVESLLALSGRKAEFVPVAHPALHPGQSAAIVRHGERVGVIGVLHPTLAAELKLPGAVLFELRLDAVGTGALPKFKALSRFPAVRRDISLLVPESTSASAVRGCIEQAGVGILEHLELFDVYQGEGIDSGMKSVSLALTFQSRSRTLDDTEINAALSVILDSLNKSLGVALRG